MPTALKRYKVHIQPEYDGDDMIVESPDGEWCALEDVLLREIELMNMIATLRNRLARNGGKSD